MSQDLRAAIAETLYSQAALIADAHGRRREDGRKRAQQLLLAGAQIVGLDAVGTWRGLCVPGWPALAVFGPHGHYPLEATGGARLADLLIDWGGSAVLDLSQLAHGEQVQFTLDFMTQLYSPKATPPAVHVFLETALFV